MTAEPLKNCPFCGGHVHKSAMFDKIICDDCAVIVSFPHYVTLLPAWNARTEPIGNSEDLPEWLIEKIENEKNYKGSTEYDDGYEAALQWVLSLKNGEP